MNEFTRKLKPNLPSEPPIPLDPFEPFYPERRRPMPKRPFQGQMIA
ncbi:MAG: hypothetical protein JSV51_05760 [Candidatus Bathyarchaeota archaeon]|nr:MAG: hypothetical protein JSV51_05760 [Candidatus Bathyarchaeota archaeon]